MKATVTMKEKKRRSTSNVASLRLPSGRNAATFARRGKGLLKKARELSTLVGIDVCVILLPPPGEDGRGSFSSLPSPPPLTWPEEPSDLLRIIHRFQSVGDGKRRKHRNWSSTSLPPPPLLTRPEEPSAMIHGCQSIDKRQNPQNCSSPPSFLLEEKHRLEQELQQVRHQNLELVALSPSCGSISKDVEPLVSLDSAFGDIDEKTQSMGEDKEFFEFFESLPQIFEFLPQTEGENDKRTDTHQQNQVVDVGQPLLLDFLPPSPLTCSPSECWDFSLQDYWGKN